MKEIGARMVGKSRLMDKCVFSMIRRVVRVDVTILIFEGAGN